MAIDTTAILTALLGALVGGPAGFLFERAYSRPRLHFEHAEALYEDLISFPVEIQHMVNAHPMFVEFAESLTSWQFKQRLSANLFTRQELSLIRPLLVHYTQNVVPTNKKLNDAVLRLMEDREALNSAIGALTVGSFEDTSEYGWEKFFSLTTLMGMYQFFFQSNFIKDYTQNPDAVLQNARQTFLSFNLSARMLDKKLEEFLDSIDDYIQGGSRQSDVIIIRIGVSNRGLQNAVVKTEAELVWEERGRKFRMPIRVGGRPWEQDPSKTLSQYFWLEPRSSYVLEFAVDEKLNAQADVDELRKSLNQGLCKLRFNMVGIKGKAVLGYKFSTTLRS